MTFSQTAFVNCSLQRLLCFSDSSALFCSPFLLFRENLESLDYPGILADKALRWVLTPAALSPQFLLKDLCEWPDHSLTGAPLPADFGPCSSSHSWHSVLSSAN